MDLFLWTVFTLNKVQPFKFGFSPLQTSRDRTLEMEQVVPDF